MHRQVRCASAAPVSALTSARRHIIYRETQDHISSCNHVPSMSRTGDRRRNVARHRPRLRPWSALWGWKRVWCRSICCKLRPPNQVVMTRTQAIKTSPLPENQMLEGSCTSVLSVRNHWETAVASVVMCWTNTTALISEVSSRLRGSLFTVTEWHTLTGA